MWNQNRTVFTAVTTLMIVALIAAEGLAQEYSIVDLALGPDAEPVSINDSGQIVGVIEESGIEQSGFVWASGVVTQLDGLSDSEFSSLSPSGINTAGEIVGVARTGNGSFQAALLTDGVLVGLGTLGGVLLPGRDLTLSFATDLNDSHQIVGSSFDQAINSEAFLWESGVMSPLGTLGGDSSWAAAINDFGQIVGYAARSDGSLHAFLWFNGGMTDLGTLEGFENSWAEDINNLAQVVGNAFGQGPFWRAFLWQAGQMVELGTFPGTRSSIANGH